MSSKRRAVFHALPPHWSGGFPHDKIGLQDVVRPFMPFELQHSLQGFKSLNPKLLARNADSRQWWPRQIGKGNIVNSDDRNVFWHSYSRLLESTHGAHGNQIVS